jgi:GNAT superfamily N-acetyltransferase
VKEVSAVTTSVKSDNLHSRYPIDYPVALESEITVGPGRTFGLRPIRSEDAEKLVTFHQHLSSDSIYRRYFSFHPELSRDEVTRFTQVDYDNRLALVIEDGDQLVAVARYDRLALTTTAEVAFIVRDDYQHLGLGRRLLADLATAAWSRGIRTFTAVTLCRNRAMMSVFLHSGFPMTSSVSQGEISLRLSIEPTQVTTMSPTAPEPEAPHPWS